MPKDNKMTWADVFGPPPVSETYHGSPSAWQGARDRYAAMVKEFVAVRAMIGVDGTVRTGGDAQLNPRQSSELYGAAHICRKLSSSGLVVERDTGPGFRFFLVLSDILTIGGSEDPATLREARPWMLPIDALTGTPEAAYSGAMRQAVDLINRGYALMLLDTSGLPAEAARRNAELLAEVRAAGPGIADLPAM